MIKKCIHTHLKIYIYLFIHNHITNTVIEYGARVRLNLLPTFCFETIGTIFLGLSIELVSSGFSEERTLFTPLLLTLAPSTFTIISDFVLPPFTTLR